MTTLLICRGRLIGLAASLGLALPALGADWPQWRGPNRDGVVRGVALPKSWPEKLTEEWKVPVGAGASSPVVVGGKVYLHVRQQPNEEVVLCLDAVSGKEAWRQAYAAPYNLGEPAHGFEGPRSTPAVAAGRLLTFGISGILSCFDAKTGKLSWRKQPVGQYIEVAPNWGTSASPLVDRGLCILHVGGRDKGALTAFDVKTGEVRWSFVGDAPAYGSPIVVDLAGQRQVVTLTLNNFVGVSADAGKLLWSIPCREIHSENCLTPVLYEDLLIFAGRKENPRAIRLQRQGAQITPVEVWRSDGPTLYMSTPVPAGEWLFGLSERNSGQLFCANAKTGATLWLGPPRLQASASLLNAGSAWLVLTSNGELIVVRPTGTRYEELAKYQAADTHIWCQPVLLDSRLLIKDDASLRSLRIK